ncbi:DUF4252 domain-containing protein [Fulvivirga sediminis]|uniref:DUF4252 domain-containing protein n=1 Tax=Fulvivirga sediminis TaxID=2803949 RepID=A0A937F971_9BACT|nr:DUF4252 domain-containing protein [Fulvivirga sediminis]MBL3658010.1 DUF4252 domain-containing protein [Fulvivirga sediminis]
MKLLLLMLAVLLPLVLSAQSKTTRDFSEDHEEGTSFFFYKNTLKMLNQTDSEEFDELIKDIDKMKYFVVEKKGDNINKGTYAELVKGYKSEQFESLMNMRHEGMKVDVYIQEDEGVTTGLVFLMNDESSLSILDIKGSVPLNKLANIISKVREFKP